MPTPAISGFGSMQSSDMARERSKWTARTDHHRDTTTIMIHLLQPMHSRHCQKAWDIFLVCHKLSVIVNGRRSNFLMYFTYNLNQKRKCT
jgi:hypothetical protein